jgi:hypothetical protein
MLDSEGSSVIRDGMFDYAADEGTEAVSLLGVNFNVKGERAA